MELLMLFGGSMVVLTVAGLVVFAGVLVVKLAQTARELRRARSIESDQHRHDSAAVETAVPGR